MEEGAKEPTVEVKLHPRSNNRPICCECSRRRPGYDTLPIRRFEFIPMWRIKVFFPLCATPGRLSDMWYPGGADALVGREHRLTESYAWFLAGWATFEMEGGGR